MFTNSLWNSYASKTGFPHLSNDITVDVAIMGGGITGITTALLLKKQGLNVAVLEAREVGKGTTGHSTGNLYVITDQLLSAIESKYDKDVLRKVIAARDKAFNLIAENINEYEIDCDYKSQSMYVYENGELDKIEKELKLASEAGIPFQEVSSVEIPSDIKKGMVLEGQATFNPLRYIQELAKIARGENCSIYENTKVTEIESGKEGFVLKTPMGKVTAKYAFHATHTPKGVKVQYHTTLGPYREYGVAVKLESDNYPEGIYWGFYGKDKFSIRSYSRNGEKYLICVGQPHKVGQAENNLEHIGKLVEFVSKNYKIKEVTHQWGGQHYKPADLLPYIGRIHGDSNELVATGFSTDGLVYGTLSAIIISDLIGGEENAYAKLFEASRHQPAKAAKEFIKENIDVAVEFFKDRFNTDDTDIGNMKPGEGRVIEKDGKKAAVHRGKDGIYTVNSAVCTHLGCIVHWNNAEETWDCPCHGSRFNTLGEVIEGPAIDPLKKIK